MRPHALIVVLLPLWAALAVGSCSSAAETNAAGAREPGSSGAEPGPAGRYFEGDEERGRGGSAAPTGMGGAVGRASSPHAWRHDDTPFPAEPDVGGSTSSEVLVSVSEPAVSPSTGDEPAASETGGSLREVCVRACKEGPPAREVFCGLVHPAYTRSCRERVSGSTAGCIAWCWWNF